MASAQIILHQCLAWALSAEASSTVALLKAGEAGLPLWVGPAVRFISGLGVRARHAGFLNPSRFLEVEASPSEVDACGAQSEGSTVAQEHARQGGGCCEPPVGFRPDRRSDSTRQGGQFDACSVGEARGRQGSQQTGPSSCICEQRRC